MYDITVIFILLCHSVWHIYMNVTIMWVAAIQLQYLKIFFVAEIVFLGQNLGGISRPAKTFQLNKDKHNRVSLLENFSSSELQFLTLKLKI